jgi:hypothetical protein
VSARQIGPKARAVLEAKFGHPKEGWTKRSRLRGIAHMGGFLARRGNGEPGWLMTWRGWERLSLLSEGYAMALEDLSCG